MAHNLYSVLRLIVSQGSRRVNKNLVDLESFEYREVPHVTHGFEGHYARGGGGGVGVCWVR